MTCSPLNNAFRNPIRISLFKSVPNITLTILPKAKRWPITDWHRKNNAEYFGTHIRNHWGIENRLHWVKDVSMKEDISKTTGGIATEKISIIRNVAINLFRLNGLDSIKYATQFYANNIKELWRLISCNTINNKIT